MSRSRGFRAETGPRACEAAGRWTRPASVFQSSPIGRLTTALTLSAFVASPTLAEELSGTLKKIQETGAITLGYREASVPFSYLDDDERPVGYAVDICKAIATHIQHHLKLDTLEIRLNPVASSTRIPLIANGTIDLECGSTTNNADRQKQVAFTNSHFLTPTRFVAKRDKHLRTVEDLKGRTVVSTSGTTPLLQINLANDARHLGLTILPAKDHAEAFLMVETGRADAFVMDAILLAALVASSKQSASFAISSDTLSKPEPYGIMLRKGDAPFKAVVDEATATLYRSGDGKIFYEKWFVKPIPPKSINLNFPMSEAMGNLFLHPSDSSDPNAY